MAEALVGTPFKCGGVAKTLPIRQHGHLKLTIRVDNDNVANRVLINVNGVSVDAEHATHYLMGGEALEIDLRDVAEVTIRGGISIINVVNDPNIYWGIA